MQTRHLRLVPLSLAVVLTSGLALTLSGQPDPADEKPAGELRTQLDREALSAMSRDQRRAAMRAHRQERQAAAREAGLVQGSPGYRPLAEPRPLKAREVRLKRLFVGVSCR